MKRGVIISSNDAEICWNALRYANFCIGQKGEGAGKLEHVLDLDHEGHV